MDREGCGYFINCRIPYRQNSMPGMRQHSANIYRMNEVLFCITFVVNSQVPCWPKLLQVEMPKDLHLQELHHLDSESLKCLKTCEMAASYQRLCFVPQGLQKNYSFCLTSLLTPHFFLWSKITSVSSSPAVNKTAWQGAL